MEQAIWVSPEEMQAQREAARCVREMPDRPRSYFIVTYGCQMNAHDSEILAGMMEQMGMTPASSREEAELILFNTCCIRDNAERKALGNMAYLRALKRSNPRLILCVCGCMIQQPRMAQVILRQYPFFDIAFGTHNLHRFSEFLLQALNTRRQVLCVETSQGRIAEGLPCRPESGISAYVSIMYGCNNFCSYCIVPYVRGRERSRAQDDILREVEGLLERGVMQITLLGQNVNSYGNDRSDGASFPALLRRLDALGVPRIRFMTSHPKDLSDELIAAMAESKHCARHFHLPVQSGSDAILKAMNRVYDRETYLRRVEALRKAMPEIALTTDVIVGFPGESEEDFADTLSLLKLVRYDSAFMFAYSPREGTRAAQMPQRVPEEIASDRLTRLIALQEGISAQALAGLVGSRQRVLVEEVSKRNARQLAGKCTRNITCNFDADPALIGSFARVLVREAGHNSLKADFVCTEEKEAPEWP
ncbi:MAG TPA: tRNA (N6-isopentenyl adenosine(37)-C2)-methylthiotransferase MiaB [Candidatus Aphodomonas merdavium]|nr:tRNA (N6-isopentenyl adenosine(37)-C2)-methylthiotransferase MiaB [Candidatus Aphodomonas merdavium]